MNHLIFLQQCRSDIIPGIRVPESNSWSTRVEGSVNSEWIDVNTMCKYTAVSNLLYSHTHTTYNLLLSVYFPSYVFFSSNFHFYFFSPNFNFPFLNVYSILKHDWSRSLNVAPPLFLRLQVLQEMFHFQSLRIYFHIIKKKNC